MITIYEMDNFPNKQIRNPLKALGSYGVEKPNKKSQSFIQDYQSWPFKKLIALRKTHRGSNSSKNIQSIMNNDSLKWI